jgi:hypothetical protein
MVKNSKIIAEKKQMVINAKEGLNIAINPLIESTTKIIEMMDESGYHKPAQQLTELRAALVDLQRSTR